MKAIYATTYDPRSIASWSGTAHFMGKALRNQSISLEYCGPLKRRRPVLTQIKQRLYRHLLHMNYLQDRDPSVLKAYARQLGGMLSNVDFDVVFSPGTLPIAYLDCPQPIVFWTDATFAGVVDFHPEFRHLCRETVDSGNAAEQSALTRCSLAIYASEWAADTAVGKYQVDASKVKVVPFGANIHYEGNLNDAKRMVDARPSDKCRLLFLGVDWYSKGGDVALEVARRLNKAGLPTELKIVGCAAGADCDLPAFVTGYGFISKTTSQGMELIGRLLAESHFLILPTRADCFGVAFCEANAFAVPCLAPSIGGIPTVIRDDFNGKLFPPGTDAEAYCTWIEELFSDYSRYKGLAISSFNEYQSRLNWSVAGRTVKSLITELL